MCMLLLHLNYWSLLFASRWKISCVHSLWFCLLVCRNITTTIHHTWHERYGFFEEPHLECADLSEMMFQNDPQHDFWKKGNTSSTKDRPKCATCKTCRYCHSLSICLVEAAVVGDFVTTKLLASLHNNFPEFWLGSQEQKCYIELYWGWMFERSVGFTNSTSTNYDILIVVSTQKGKTE